MITAGTKYVINDEPENSVPKNTEPVMRHAAAGTRTP